MPFLAAAVASSNFLAAPSFVFTQVLKVIAYHNLEYKIMARLFHLHLQHMRQGAATRRRGEATRRRTAKPAKIPMT